MHAPNRTNSSRSDVPVMHCTSSQVDVKDTIHRTPKPKSQSRIPLLLRTPLPSRGPRTPESTRPPPGIPFPTEMIGDGPDVEPKATAVLHSTSPPVSRTTSGTLLRADFEEYMNNAGLDSHSRVNPPPSREVLIANGIIEADPDDEELLSPLSPCFTIPDYGSQTANVTCARGRPPRPAVPPSNPADSERLQRSKPPKTPERVDPKTIIRDISKKPPTDTGGSPLRYYAMLANADKAAANSGARVLFKF